MLLRSIAVGGIVAVSLTSGASAESYFVCMGSVPAKSVLDLGLITSEGDGVVEIYDYRLGEKGEMLGTIDVHEGANPDVRFDIGMPPRGDLLALLTVDGEVVASNVYDVCEAN